MYEGDAPDRDVRVGATATATATGDRDVSDGISDVASGPASAPPPAPGHFDMSTLHDEIETDAARPKREPFHHHSEETMGGYEEEEPSPRRHAPSPESADSWMAYSSTSSESWRGEAEAEPESEDAEVEEVAEDSERVDIRMIDFAHTAYAGAAASSPLATATPHDGPDCGFLTGVDSLKRLLVEILPPSPPSPPSAPRSPPPPPPRPRRDRYS